MQNFKIYQLPLWEDNYIYVIHDRQANQTAAVDPGEAETVNTFLKSKNLKLNIILSTHHHFDHTGGNIKLKQIWRCKIYGFKQDAHRIPGIDIELKEGDSAFVGSLEFKVLYVPGHTLGHIAFWNPQHHILFCGDTLFAMGCGRLFEGTPEQMFSSLNKIKKLPSKSLIYSAHEYTLNNARFALSQEPSYPTLQKRFKKVSALKEQDQATVPFYLEEDLLTNPFLRAKSVEEFARLRKLKDQF